jgi:hypothetical protein
MFEPDGTFHFMPDLLQALDKFMAEYEDAKGPLRNDLERGLVISYALGTMRCDLEMLWDCLGSSPAFGSLHPRIVFEDCTCSDGDPTAGSRQATLEEELRKRGWLSSAEE